MFHASLSWKKTKNAHVACYAILGVHVRLCADWCPQFNGMSGLRLYQGVYPTPPSCTTRDTANGTMSLCGAKCNTTPGCLAFEVATPDCWIFVGTLAPPFTPNTACKACVKNNQTAGIVNK